MAVRHQASNERTGNWAARSRAGVTMGGDGRRMCEERREKKRRRREGCGAALVLAAGQTCLRY